MTPGQRSPIAPIGFPPVTEERLQEDAVAAMKTMRRFVRGKLGLQE